MDTTFVEKFIYHQADAKGISRHDLNEYYFNQYRDIKKAVPETSDDEIVLTAEYLTWKHFLPTLAFPRDTTIPTRILREYTNSKAAIFSKWYENGAKAIVKSEKTMFGPVTNTHVKAEPAERGCDAKGRTSQQMSGSARMDMIFSMKIPSKATPVGEQPAPWIHDRYLNNIRPPRILSGVERTKESKYDAYRDKRRSPGAPIEKYRSRGRSRERWSDRYRPYRSRSRSHSRPRSERSSSHRGKKMVCKDCNALFTSSDTIKEHLKYDCVRKELRSSAHENQRHRSGQRASRSSPRVDRTAEEADRDRERRKSRSMSPQCCSTSRTQRNQSRRRERSYSRDITHGEDQVSRDRVAIMKEKQFPYIRNLVVAQGFSNDHFDVAKEIFITRVMSRTYEYATSSIQWLEWKLQLLIFEYFFKTGSQFPMDQPRGKKARIINGTSVSKTKDIFEVQIMEKYMEKKAIATAGNIGRSLYFQALNKQRHLIMIPHSHYNRDQAHYLIFKRVWDSLYPNETFPANRPASLSVQGQQENAESFLRQMMSDAVAKLDFPLSLPTATAHAHPFGPAQTSQPIKSIPTIPTTQIQTVPSTSAVSHSKLELESTQGLLATVLHPTLRKYPSSNPPLAAMYRLNAPGELMNCTLDNLKNVTYAFLADHERIKVEEKLGCRFEIKQVTQESPLRVSSMPFDSKDRAAEKRGKLFIRDWAACVLENGVVFMSNFLAKHGSSRYTTSPVEEGVRDTLMAATESLVGESVLPMQGMVEEDEVSKPVEVSESDETDSDVELWLGPGPIPKRKGGKLEGHGAKVKIVDF